MTCPYNQQLQAYLDGELKREERKALTIHLQSCPSCRFHLQELKSLDEWFDRTFSQTLLTSSMPVLDEEADPTPAWEKFKLKVDTGSPLPVPEKSIDLNYHTLSTLERSPISMKKFRKLFTGAAAVVIFASFLMIPQVQTMASDFLSLFRVNQIEMVKVTPEDLQEMQNFFQSTEKAEISLENLGRIWIEEGGFNQEVYHTADEAVQAGVALPALPPDYEIEQVRFQSSATVNMELNTEKANALMKSLGSDAAFPETLNGKQFSVTWPESLHIRMKSTNTESYDNMIFSILDAPEIAAPSLTDAENLRTTLLQAPFIPEGIRSQLAQIKDWKNTLPFPYMENTGEVETTEKISVNGGDGIFMKSRDNSAAILWEEDGHLYSIHITDNSVFDTNTAKSSLLELAKEL